MIYELRMGVKEKFLRKLAVYPIWWLKKTSIRAEYIATAWIFLEIISVLMLVIGKYYYSLFAVILFQIASFGDFIDGAIARHQKNYSKKWVLIDGISHNIISSLILFCLGYGLYNSTNKFIFFFLGAVGALTILLTHLAKMYLKNIEDSNNKKARRRRYNEIYLLIWDFIRLEQPLNFLFFAIIFNISKFALIFYSILFSLNCLLWIYKLVIVQEDKNAKKK